MATLITPAASPALRVASPSRGAALPSGGVALANRTPFSSPLTALCHASWSQNRNPSRDTPPPRVPTCPDHTNTCHVTAARDVSIVRQGDRLQGARTGHHFWGRPEGVSGHTSWHPWTQDHRQPSPVRGDLTGFPSRPGQTRRRRKGEVAPFPASPLELGRLLSSPPALTLGLSRPAPWFSAFGLGLSHSTSLPGPPACGRHTVGHPRLPEHGSQSVTPTAVSLSGEP